MSKILISGYYGFNNIGDESILKAVVESLKEKLDNAEITVLSQNPADTAEKFGVRAASRKSIGAILRELKRCDLLVSGGGSLLQDATSKRSIVYYLAIIRLARFFGKKVFIYSQGVGPINSKFNRRLTASTLKKVQGIVVRDMASKLLLAEIGVPEERVEVATDPVLRIKPADLAIGAGILAEAGLKREEGDTVVGFAVKEKHLDSVFVDELTLSMEKLLARGKTKLVLIPFHFGEDMAPAAELMRRLTEKGCADGVCVLKEKHLTDEMLSIIGNMDVLVGVRLHALIHAAIMGVPMIGIAYDPKINSFLSSIGLRAMSSIYDFDSDYFCEVYDKTLAERDEQMAKVAARVEALVKSLDRNEEEIKEILGV